MILLAACGQNRSQIEKVYENGVEVILNHVEPYVLPGVPSSLELEERMVIDTENEAVAKTGLTAIETFGLDRDGNIYLMMRQSPGMFIYKFDGEGKFLISFGRKGQGPGEFEWGGDIVIDEENRVIAKDMTKRKYFVFSRDGVLLEEAGLEKNMNLIQSLGGNTFLTQWQEEDNGGKPMFRNHFCVFNRDLSSAREFDSYEFDNILRSTRYVPWDSASVLGASGRNLFTGDSRNGYEINVFDFAGKLVKKVRKEFRSVPLSDAKKRIIRRIWERRGGQGQEMLRKLSFPSHMPPFQYLFSDEQGKLYVMTNERKDPRSFWYDIFTAEGVFIGRFLLDNVQITYFEGQEFRAEPTGVMVKDDRLYCLREKDNGFMTLTAYKMKWK